MAGRAVEALREVPAAPAQGSERGQGGPGGRGAGESGEERGGGGGKEHATHARSLSQSSPCAPGNAHDLGGDSAGDCGSQYLVGHSAAFSLPGEHLSQWYVRGGGAGGWASARGDGGPGGGAWAGIGVAGGHRRGVGPRAHGWWDEAAGEQFRAGLGANAPNSSGCLDGVGNRQAAEL